MCFAHVTGYKYSVDFIQTTIIIREKESGKGFNFSLALK